VRAWVPACAVHQIDLRGPDQSRAIFSSGKLCNLATPVTSKHDARARENEQSRPTKHWLQNIPSRADQVRFVIVAVPLVMAPLWSLGFAESRFEPYDQIGWAWRLLLSLPLAALLILTVGGLAWVVFSRSSVRRLSTLCIAFAMPVLAYQAIGYADVAGDHHPGVPVSVECVQYFHRARGADVMELRSWHDPKRTMEVLNVGFCKAECSKGKPVRIIVHPGRLGMEWVTPDRK
jgi:hypothetical protein